MNQIRQYFFIILLIIAAILLGVNYYYRPFETKLDQNQLDSQNQELIQDRNSPEYILSQLSSQEKVAQLIAQPIEVSEYFAPNPSATQTATINTGFYTLFGENLSLTQAQQVIIDLKKNRQVDRLFPWIAVDHEGGSVQRLSGEGFTKLKSWREICAMETIDRQAELKKSANELRLVGVNVIFAPVLDVGNNLFLKDRICSADSYALVADRGMDFTTIFSNVGIMPVLKHFPGIGLTDQDLHKAFDFISVLEFDVKLYKYILDQNNLIGVMTAHVGVTSQDKDKPCSLSTFCVGELNTAYPDILVFTDALDMKAALYDYENPLVDKNLIRVSLEAIGAGNNVLVYGPGVNQNEITAIIDYLTQVYDENPVFKALVDKSVTKIIKYKVI
jgi:beta-N-acetylhexosaminidase